METTRNTATREEWQVATELRCRKRGVTEDESSSSAVAEGPCDTSFN